MAGDGKFLLDSSPQPLFIKNTPAKVKPTKHLLTIETANGDTHASIQYPITLKMNDYFIIRTQTNQLDTLITNIFQYGMY